MRKLFWLLIMAVFALNSCEKNEETPQASNYLPLSIGNYWIYDVYNIDYQRDSNGYETKLSKQDTIEVVGDTIIRGITYYKVSNFDIQDNLDYPYRGVIRNIRDSAGYYVGDKGNIYLSYSNFTDTLINYARIDSHTVNQLDTLFTLTFRMEHSQVFNVPAGNFDAINMRGTCIVSEHQRCRNTPVPIYVDQCYTNKIGKILENTTYVCDGGKVERRLVKYDVK